MSLSKLIFGEIGQDLIKTGFSEKTQIIRLSFSWKGSTILYSRRDDQDQASAGRRCPCRLWIFIFVVTVIWPESPAWYLRNLSTNHEGYGRDLGRSRRLLGLERGLPRFKTARTSTSRGALIEIEMSQSVLRVMFYRLNWNCLINFLLWISLLEPWVAFFWVSISE